MMMILFMIMAKKIMSQTQWPQFAQHDDVSDLKKEKGTKNASFGKVHVHLVSATREVF